MGTIACSQRVLVVLSLALLSVLGACMPAVAPGQVAVRFSPPPGRMPALQQIDESACTRGAAGYVKLYVECMQRRGYVPEIVGADGAHLTTAQLPEPPAGVARPTAPVAMSPMPAPVAAAPTSCESQANSCQPCQNGRYRGTGFLCQYDSLSSCRSSILQFCKANPVADGALNVRNGRLTDDQVLTLMMSCPNVPHGSIPYSGSPPVQGSKKWQQCQAFEKTYFACSMLTSVGENRRFCFRNTYSGP